MILHAVDLSLVAQCVSWIGELQTLCVVDWCFGFKLHLVVNERLVLLTPGNTNDSTPVPQLLQHQLGNVFGDRGYVSQKLALELW